MKNSTKPVISIIVAIAKNRGIGKNNQLLFDIPEDLLHFKKITENHPVIMGENTYYSIGRPLPQRTNIVLTRNQDLKIEGCLVCFSIEEAIARASEIDKEEIFFIGGGMIYKQALPLADKLYLTVIDAEPDADVFFPEYEKVFTKVVKEEPIDNGKYKFKFLELVKTEDR